MKTMNIASPNHTQRYTRPIQLIVLHHTATSPHTGLAVARLFSARAAQVSSHEIVDTNGTIYHCVDWSQRAWHAGSGSWQGHGDVNSISLGIEIVNRGDGKDPYSDLQLKSIASLIRRMQAKYPTIKPWNIVDHESVSSAGKIDLRSNFPAERLMWMVIHPNLTIPAKMKVYPWMLPKWARIVCADIKAQKGPILR